jgi:hypothetical protein
MTGIREFPDPDTGERSRSVVVPLSDSPMQSSVATLRPGSTTWFAQCRSRRVRKRLDAAQHWRGLKLPSIVTVPGSSTTTTDHPPLVGRTQPVEADRYRDQRTRRAY